ncbi:MAG: efflux RND transporter permease subunit, partial [Candidatus Omnitrophica bacterium]|nr:efflux RND transporter permease subunit [Candidatus Omnitrophota bacterium]
YPENVDKPILNAAGAESPPVVWVMLKTAEGNDRPVSTYLTYLEEELRQYFERIDGVADLFIRGGAETEMQVSVEPESLASYQLTIDDVITALQRGNANISAGNLPVGRHDNRIRSVAEYRDVNEILNVVLKSDGEREVKVGDVASADFGYEKMDTPVISRYDPGIAIGVRMEPYTNILDLTDRVEQVVEELNDGVLKEKQLWLQIVSERRPYIRGAINLLKQNILIGGSLAIIILLIFLRSIAPTIVAGTAIPISIIGTFVALLAMGSTLNVVSLAGIAFAVGMLVDNAIVVLENIDRHKGMGKSPFKASYDGTKEVWGAVLASTLTTVAVFLPVVFLEDEAGQLFRDIALATSVSVTLSLIVSVTVIPMFSNKLYTWTDSTKVKGIKRITKPLAKLGTLLADGIMAVVALGIRNVFTRLVTIFLLTGGAFLTVYTLIPKMEYLPQGNRDLIVNVLIPPPGLSYEERRKIGEDLFEDFLPYFEKSKDGLPPVRHMFYVGSQQSMIFGVVSADQLRTPELIPVCKEIVSQIPGVFAITNQANIFQRGIGEGRSVSVDFSGSNLDEIVQAAGAAMGKIRGAIQDVQVRPIPSLDMLFPESNFIPERDLLRSVGMTAEQFGVALDVLMDGRDIGDFKEEGKKKIDLILKVADSEVRTPEELYNSLLVTPMGRTVQVASLSKMEKTAGLSEIRHLERDRTVSLQVSPPYETTIQETMEIIDNEVLSDLRDRGLLNNIRVGMSG